MELNNEDLHLFIEGMKNSREQHAEENKSYEYGLNGRLYSKNGKLAFSSIKGTLEIYDNPKIIKYLGFYAFPDELVLFVKYDARTGVTVSNAEASIFASNVELTIPFGASQFDVFAELSENAYENVNTVIENTLPTQENPLEDNYSEDVASDTIDLSDYYELSGTNIPNYDPCESSGLESTEYNDQYDDAIIILKRNGYSALDDGGAPAWVGKMNWDINRKITTVGIDENMYYKRVYFTDNLNPLRVFNLRDNSLSYRDPDEFNIKQNSTMLQAEVKAIKDGGAVKAMSVQYTYKLITENGQVTKFAPYSEMIYIVKDNDGYDFAGGDIEETTSKQVVISCPVLNQNYKEIQCIAIEYAADTIPTAIRNLGIKPIGEIVEFVHTGNESEFSENFTLEDITETGNIWTYCNDITSKNNKLIAAGLRNEPYALQEKYVQDLFLFKGWNETGGSHDFLINPDPKEYRFIDPSNNEKSVFLKKQLFNRFLFFGDFTLSFINKLEPTATQTISFKSSSDQYIDYIESIWIWLRDLDLTLFPNLDIVRSDKSILFKPKVDTTQTDFFDYYFESSISQAIIDFDNEYEFYTVTPNLSNLVYGAQSVGFNQGTGVRITYKEAKDPVMDKSPELYKSGPVLDLRTPSLKKTFVKTEIYRTSIQFFKKGDPLFAIVLGDFYTPGTLDLQKGINSDGSLFFETDKTYVNQSIELDTLYAHRLELNVEVRIPCRFKSAVDSYQIQYVERTENNRTILAQGLSAPLLRNIAYLHPSKSGEERAPNVFNKWMLPFNGGPLYTVGNGFKAFDNPVWGEDFNDIEKSSTSKERAALREITNRKMFYFDSPDIIYERVSPELIANSKIHVIGRLNTDATGSLIRAKAGADATIHNDYNPPHAENQVYQTKSFSKKLGYEQVSGDDDLKPYTTNISVFSEFTPQDIWLEVENHSKNLLKGEIIPNAVLGSSFESTNMSLALFMQGAYNSGQYRAGSLIYEQFGLNKEFRYVSESGIGAQESAGYPTVFIRTKEDLFTDAFIGPQANINPIKSYPISSWSEEYLSDIDKNDIDYLETSDSHALVNIVIGAEDSIYGGRTKYAYSQNVFIPLGPIIPIKGTEGDNQAQKFTVTGDFFVSLFLRTKNDYSDALPLNEEKSYYKQSTTKYKRTGRNMPVDWQRGGAWAYAVILETEVESRFASEYRYYKATESIVFHLTINEFINTAYYKKNNLRLYSSVPYNFKDDPLMTNVLSSSKTKLSGDYFDAWTEFLLNEFYELEKNKGIITNVTNWKESIFAIQEQETSEVFIDESDFVTTDSGESVAIKKGDGTTFTNHKKVSDFGTSIRRALGEGELGFSFFDEKNRAFVKFGKSLSLEQELQMKLHELFENDKVVDTEAYYDIKYKETNIRIRTESGQAYLLSYNELEQKFNGWYSYDHDVYIPFDKRVFVPCCGPTNIVVYCPEIISDDTITVQIHKYFEYQINATQDPISFAAEDLPIGVSFNTESGLLYGTITTPGTYIVPITAQNIQCSDTLELIVTASIDKLEGVSNSVCPAQGVLTGTQLMEGESNGSATVTGVLGWAGIDIDGESNGVATVTATIIGNGALEGIILGTADTSLLTPEYLSNCQVILHGIYGIYSYDPQTNVAAKLPVPNYPTTPLVALDIAHTQNKMWTNDSDGYLNEWDITLAPFTAVWATKFWSYSGSPGLAALDDNTLAVFYYGSLYEIDITNRPWNQHINTYKWDLPWSEYITGDYIVTNTVPKKLIASTFLSYSSQRRIRQWDYETGVMEYTQIISPQITQGYGLMMDNSELYIVDDATKKMFKINHLPPYQITEVNDYPIELETSVYGASQIPTAECLNIAFTPITIGLINSFPTVDGTLTARVAISGSSSGQATTSADWGVNVDAKRFGYFYLHDGSYTGEKANVLKSNHSEDLTIANWADGIPNAGPPVAKFFDKNVYSFSTEIPHSTSSTFTMYMDDIIQGVQTYNFDPALGHTMHYWISPAQKGASSYNDVIANMTKIDVYSHPVQANQWAADFPWALNPDINQYVYIIVDFRKEGGMTSVSDGVATTTSDLTQYVAPPTPIEGESNGASTVTAETTDLTLFSESLIIGAEVPWVYNPETGQKRELTVPTYGFENDIAHTANKLWESSGRSNPSLSLIREWDITLDPFTAVFNRDLQVPFSIGLGLCAIDDTTLIVTEYIDDDVYNNGERFVEIDVTNLVAVPTVKFQMPYVYQNIVEIVSGDYALTTQGKLIILVDDWWGGNYTKIQQWDWATQTLEIDEFLPDYISRPFGFAFLNGKIYLFEASGTSITYEVNTVFPFGLTLVESLPNTWISGASQIPSAVDVSLEYTMVGRVYGSAAEQTSVLGNIPGQMTSHEIQTGKIAPDTLGNKYFWASSSYTHEGMGFQPLEKNIMAVEMKLGKLGSPDLTLRAQIWTGSGNFPQGQEQLSSNTLETVDIIEGDIYKFYFDGSNYVGSNVFIVLHIESSVFFDNSNRPALYSASFNDITTNAVKKIAGWSANGGSARYMTIIYNENQGTLTGLNFGFNGSTNLTGTLTNATP